MDVLRLHKLTDRDRQGQLIEVYNEGKQDTAAAASDLLVYHTPVPQDKMLLVESWCVLVVSDMSEPYQAAFGASFTLSGTQYFAALHEKFWNFEGNGTVYISNTLPMIILPEEVPAVKAFWYLAGNHTLSSRLRGWLIPKGNIGRGFGGL